MNTGRASNTGRGSDIIVLIEAGGFYSRKYGKFIELTITETEYPEEKLDYQSVISSMM